MSASCDDDEGKWKRDKGIQSHGSLSGWAGGMMVGWSGGEG
jgi:hypothetical protein